MAALARRRAVAERRFVFQPLKRLILFFRRILRQTQPADERFVFLRFKTHAVQTSFGVVGPLDGQRRVLRALFQTVAEDAAEKTLSSMQKLLKYMNADSDNPIFARYFGKNWTLMDVMMNTESGNMARMALRMTKAGIAKEDDWKEFIRQLERKKLEEQKE